MTAITTHARYYSLHSLVWAEAERLHLSPDDARALMRRSEVVLAAVTLAHLGSHARPIDNPHGVNTIGPYLETHDAVDLDHLAGPGIYTRQTNGFASPYVQSERALGIVGPGRIPTGGSRVDHAALSAALGDILRLARRKHLSWRTLEGASSLCLCHMPDGADGAWLARLFCRPTQNETYRRDDEIRRATIQLMLRAVDVVGARDSIEVAFADAVAFGGFATSDKVARELVVTSAWRGVTLRNHSVSAWRRLWARLVDILIESGTPLTADELAESFSAGLAADSGYPTVQDLLENLPDTMASAHPAPAELDVFDAGLPPTCTDLRVLALGGRRTQDLRHDERGFDHFAGRDDELGPQWVFRHLEQRHDQHLDEFIVDLVHRLLMRARRVSLNKARFTAKGLYVPTRLRERDGRWFAVDKEGDTPVGLRIGSLGSVLYELGVLDWDYDTGDWSVSKAGQKLVA